MKKIITPTVLILLIIWSCSPNKSSEETSGTTVPIDENPAAEGFNFEASDPQAIKIADDVMNAMGGRKNWDATRGLSWNFFDVRKLYWDKSTGDVRVQYLRADLETIVNIYSGEGKVKKDGEELTNPDSIELYTNRAKSAWINDSYWLVMPFKLKDSGVTLRFVDVDTTQSGDEAYLLDLSFDGVGITPENYYQIWVDTDTRLVSQWAYYKEATQSEPNFILPWQQYEQYGNIKLSGNRGERALTEIKVHDDFPETFFTDFSPINI